jgi:acyl transferase domain-containing protein
LTAIHYACLGLNSGECEAAICGGANLLLLPNNAVRMSQLGALSPSGQCKPFDAGADGYGRADGAAVIVLKRLSDAVANGDRIYGLISGTGICHGGRAPLGPWAPRSDQQAALFTKVLADAGKSVDDVDYIEAHGTGTRVGDKEEMLALAEAYGSARKSPLPFGSVKRTFNHSEAAAGITGVLKAIAMVTYGGMPPTVVDTPRKDVPMERLGLRLVDRYEPFATDRPPVVGVNSYGVAGAYANVLIEGPPRGIATGRDAPFSDERALLFPVSGKSAAALGQSIAQIASFVESAPELDLGDVSYTLSRRRNHHDYRTAVVAATREQLVASLRAVVPPTVPALRSTNLVFVFSGTGPQWWGMGRELMAAEPVVKDALERFDAEWTKISDWSLLEEMRTPEAQARIGTRTRHSTVAQVALQVALAELYRSWGIVPEQITGHSLGEMAAAYVAGAISLRHLAGMTLARCNWQDLVEGAGTMAAVGLSDRETRRYIETHSLDLDKFVLASLQERRDCAWAIKYVFRRDGSARRARMCGVKASRVTRLPHELPLLLVNVLGSARRIRA